VEVQRIDARAAPLHAQPRDRRIDAARQQQQQAAGSGGRQPAASVDAIERQEDFTGNHVDVHGRLGRIEIDGGTGALLDARADATADLGRERRERTVHTANLHRERSARLPAGREHFVDRAIEIFEALADATSTKAVGNAGNGRQPLKHTIDVGRADVDEQARPLVPNVADRKSRQAASHVLEQARDEHRTLPELERDLAEMNDEDVGLHCPSLTAASGQ